MARLDDWETLMNGAFGRKQAKQESEPIVLELTTDTDDMASMAAEHTDAPQTADALDATVAAGKKISDATTNVAKSVAKNVSAMVAAMKTSDDATDTQVTQNNSDTAKTAMPTATNSARSASDGVMDAQNNTPAATSNANHSAVPNVATDTAPSTGNTAQPDDLADPFAALTAALVAQQKNIDEQLRLQQEQLRKPVIPDLGITAPDLGASATAQHTEAQAMLASLEKDGLLANGTSAQTPATQGSFEGLADELKETVLGQDAFVDSLVRAMRRPFIFGSNPPHPRNVVLIHGGNGTGRHFALPPLLTKMAARGLIKNESFAKMDLSLYADSGNEKIFLQDLYAALHTSGEFVIFEQYEQCHPSFLKTLASLCITGNAPLNSRYILNKEGILIDAGTALAPNAIRALDPCGKYFIFYSKKGKASVADHFGADMLRAIGDICTTAPFAPEALTQIATNHLAQLTQTVNKRLGFTLKTQEGVYDFVAAQAQTATGANGIVTACKQIYRALSEYCLAQDALPEGTMTLSMQEDALSFALNDADPAPLFALLPTEYQGSRAKTEAALDALVGLDSVKQYVRALADNLEIQKRRSAAGMKNATLSMHMIFSGNPGTGKTTIARLVAQYLKAIGALRGGQLIEVSRGDLVGRYSGHTAPLTNNVIESALGGVLFIDEAYSLYRGEQDSFGLEAIDTLVKGMEDHRDDLVVVLAGYTNEMNVFLTANSGLASRFSNNIEFPDYTAEELLAITKLQAGGKGYTLDASCDIALLGFYGAQQAQHADTAGNGRLARNTLEKAILNQSKRLIATPDAPLDVLLDGDFDLTIESELA